MNDLKKVIPNSEHNPERIYVHDGNGLIICYSIPKFSRSGFTPGNEELFRFQINKSNAELLMEDIYYGEYTGG